MKVEFHQRFCCTPLLCQQQCDQGLRLHSTSTGADRFIVVAVLNGGPCVCSAVPIQTGKNTEVEAEVEAETETEGRRRSESTVLCMSSRFDYTVSVSMTVLCIGVCLQDLTTL